MILRSTCTQLTWILAMDASGLVDRYALYVHASVLIGVADVLHAGCLVRISCLWWYDEEEEYKMQCWGKMLQFPDLHRSVWKALEVVGAPDKCSCGHRLNIVGAFAHINKAFLGLFAWTTLSVFLNEQTVFFFQKKNSNFSEFSNPNDKSCREES